MPLAYAMLCGMIIKPLVHPAVMSSIRCLALYLNHGELLRVVISEQESYAGSHSFTGSLGAYMRRACRLDGAML